MQRLSELPSGAARRDFVAAPTPAARAWLWLLAGLAGLAVAALLAWR